MTDQTTTPDLRRDVVERYQRHLGSPYGRELHDLAEIDILAGDLRELVRLAAIGRAAQPDPFGQWLDAAMRHHDLGHGDIATASHHELRPGQIIDWRHGRGAPTAGEAFTLANAIGEPVVDVLRAAGHGHLAAAIGDELRDEAAASAS
jgi:hypothetical protein